MMKRLFFAITMIISCSLATFAIEGSWNFKSYSSADATLLNGDATNWKYDSTNDRWENQTAIEGALTAGGSELAYAKGLKIHAVVGGLRPGSKRLAMNNSGTTITIPSCTAGHTVTVSYANSGSTSRGLYVSNVTLVSGTIGTKVSKGTDYSATMTVNADGDVVISSTDGAMYVYSISVSAPGGSDGEDGTATTYDVSINPQKNQMHVALKNGDVKFYDTDAVKSVSVEGNNVTVTPKTGSGYDLFEGTVANISAAKAIASSNEGEWENASGIKIIDAEGWQESAFITFEKYEGAASYHVYVNDQKLDYQLVRDYGTYGRADAVGLAAGTYTIKVVAVDNSGNEIAASENSATNIKVVNYDRAGFAHSGNYGTGVGAYKDDGTLKDNADVLYITNDNFNTVTLTMTTSEKGATSEITGLGNIFKTLQKGYAHNPIAVRFIGCIDAATIGTSNLLSDQTGLLLKGNNTSINMEVTIEGIGNDAYVKGFGLGINSGANVEIRNIGVLLCLKAKDCTEIKETNHIWVHNMDYFYDQKGSGDQTKGDGTLDSKDDCTYATFSYNHYWDSGKANLCGMKSEHTSNLITYHGNWFDHSDSRHPRVRTSTVHVWNNYFDGVAKYGIGATMGCSIFSEGNFFRDTNYPMLSSKQGRDAEGSGTFSGENGGIIKSYGNVYVEKSGNFACYTQNTPGRVTNDIDCYEVENRDDKVPASVVTIAGGTGYNNFDTDPSIMYSYSPIAAADVPAKVTGFYGAGRLQHGDLQYKFDNSVDDHDYEWNDALAAVLTAYKTSLVGIFPNK